MRNAVAAGVRAARLQTTYSTRVGASVTSIVLGYLWLGLVGGLFAFVLWFRGLTALPVTSVAVLVLLSPLVAAVLGAVLLGQTLGPVQLMGFALCLGAIVAGQLPPAGRPSRSPACRCSSCS